MTISATVTCSTCRHKIRLRHQVGAIHPVQVRIACNGCGKIIKGIVDLQDPTFNFPNDSVSKEYQKTTQTVSISTEFPIVIKTTNQNSPFQLTPFLAITDIVKLDKIMLYGASLSFFKELYDAKYKHLITCFELFENKNWKYFLSE